MGVLLVNTSGWWNGTNTGELALLSFLFSPSRESIGKYVAFVAGSFDKFNWIQDR